ncbi:uncharacterized protein LOC123538183 [Mercenaria mercenaria]|uniref:uncharacterized protein LOC123538183 n=1 Tax=Mercenaria mercenaria TaxID=6596 RepID=UPI00234E7FA1|nr:uncharacterized protein LOC123538183 [Mercenaria mercenaria]
MAHGPYAYSLYKKALEAGIEDDSSIRVNVVGNFGQGKTCLVRRLIRSGIDGTKSTNGIDIVHYKCKQDASGNITYEESPDFDPSDIARRVKTVSFEGRTEKKYHKAILRRFRQFSVKKNRKKRIEKIEIAESESGYKPNEMSQEEREKFVDEVIKPYEQHSSHCNNKAFDIWDFGGQYVFYATHTLFHSRKAIYLLVFNLSCGLTDIVPNDSEEICSVNMGERTMEYYIQFWVNSIHSFVGNKDGSEPKIILVGTHFDNLEGDDRSKRRQANRYFDDVRALFQGKQQRNHIVPDDFAVDNTNFKERKFDNLRETILRVGQKYAISNKIPAKWIQLERSLFNYKQDKIVDMAVIIDIDSTNEYPLGTTEQIKLFLKHKHDQGTLFYFDEEPISNYVVLDPQFLVDAFKCIITADRFIRNLPEVTESWLMLKTEGKLEMPLIDKLWGNDEDKQFMTHKKTILWFLQKHRIISEAMNFDETEQIPVGLGWYVVPSLLKDHSQVAEMKDFQTGKKQTQIKFVISFDNSSIVPTIYHRLTAAVLGKWSIQTFRKKKLLFENMSVVRLDLHHAGITEMNDRHIQLAVLNLCPPYNVNKMLPDAFRRFVEAVIVYEFRKYQGAEKHNEMPYKRGFSCNHEIHNVGYNQTVVTCKQLDNPIVPCPEAESHNIDAVVAKAEWFQGDEMPKFISKEILSDKSLSKLSQVIGQNWNLLGPQLGLTKVQIDHIIEENPRSPSMNIYTMLLKWRDQSPDKASLDELVNILQRCTSITVNWDEMRNIAEELKEHEQLKSAK